MEGGGGEGEEGEVEGVEKWLEGRETKKREGELYPYSGKSKAWNWIVIIRCHNGELVQIDILSVKFLNVGNTTSLK